MSWAEIARTHFLNKCHPPTIETIETPLSEVLMVPAATPVEQNDPLDDRHTCTACRNLWPGNHCLTHRAAGLTTRDLAPDFTLLMQRCPAWSAKS